MNDVSAHTTPSTHITYGEHTVDITALPPSSVTALLRRGLAHYLGNEVASKVSTFKAKDREGDLGLPNDVEVATYRNDAINAALAAMFEGTMGQGRVGTGTSTRSDPVATLARQIATKEVRAVLKANSLAFPTGDKVVTFPDGSTLSGVELVDRRLAHATHGPRIRTEAEKELRAKERMAAKASENGNLAEALGL